MKRDRVGFEVAETPFGFRWGPMEVVRAVSYGKHGLVVEIKTQYGQIDVRVSPDGRMADVSSGKKHGISFLFL
jgi:hypothetical protein